MTMAEGGWGEPESINGPSEGFSLHRDLGGDITVDIDPDAARALLASPEVREAVRRYADALAAEATALAVHVGREDRPDPIYVAAGAHVEPLNYQAVLDNATHSTLFKIMARHTDE